jgi:hypothetical protein
MNDSDDDLHVLQRRQQHYLHCSSLVLVPIEVLPLEEYEITATKESSSMSSFDKVQYLFENVLFTN